MFKRPCLVAALLTFCCLTLKGQTLTEKLKAYQALIKNYSPVACQKENPADTEALKNLRAKAAKDSMEVLKTSGQQLKPLIDGRLKELQGMGLNKTELARLSQFYKGQEAQIANPCADTPSPATNQEAHAATANPTPRGKVRQSSHAQPAGPAAPKPSGAGASGQKPPAAETPAPSAQKIQSTSDQGTKPPSKTGATGLYTLMMAGLDITSTTTSGPQQQFFTEFDLTAPIGIPRILGGGKAQKKEIDPLRSHLTAPSSTRGSKKREKKEIDPLQSHFWVWFNPRIASVPTPKTAVLSSLATSNAGLPAFGNMTLGDISQSLEFHGGLAFPIITPRQGLLFASDRKSSMSMSLLISLGAVTPFNSVTGAQEWDLASSTSPGDVTNVWKQFENSEALQNQYPQLYDALKTNCVSSLNDCSLLHTAFVLPDRSRFLRTYSAGLRLRTFFFNDRDSSHVCTANMLRSNESLNYCVPRDVFPGTFDLTFGQDETVTGGRLVGTVMTVAASYPFPHHPWLRIFGQANMRLAHNHNSEPLTLPPTLTFVPLTDPSVIIQNVQPRDQDYFRIGFGVDLTKAFAALQNEASKAPKPMLMPTGDISFESGKSIDITVMNIGVSPLKIDSVTKSGANSGDFVITDPKTCEGKSLEQAKGCTMKVTFKPPTDATPGSRSATLSIKDNAPEQPQIITLTGTVTAKPPTPQKPQKPAKQPKPN